MELQTIGIIGAGIMGSGVSLNLAQTNHKVILVDISSEILNNSAKKSSEAIRMQKLLSNKRGNIPSPEEVLDRIKFTTDYELLNEVDFVIENVTERWSSKAEVYPKLDNICSKECIFATNTSTIPITRIASLTGRAKQIIGMHFMNPVPLKPVVEVIRGYHTSEETINFAKKLLQQMGKEAIVVNDSPGFVSNRVLMLTINEAIYLQQEQVASAEDVDRIFKTCFGHKMGPLETADLIGLDTILYSLESLHENFKDSKYRPCPLLKKMVDAGLYGQKSGKGFYNYPN
jgi:3-hydroxybutyryl-CoA dehydrogenase